MHAPVARRQRTPVVHGTRRRSGEWKWRMRDETGRGDGDRCAWAGEDAPGRELMQASGWKRLRQSQMSVPGIARACA